MRKIVVRPRNKGRFEICRDLLRNVELIPESAEPVFFDTFVVPAGARRLEVQTKRDKITLTFL